MAFNCKRDKKLAFNCKRDKNDARLKFTLINAILFISHVVVEIYQVHSFKYCVSVQFWCTNTSLMLLHTSYPLSFRGRYCVFPLITFIPKFQLVVTLQIQINKKCMQQKIKIHSQIQTESNQPHQVFIEVKFWMQMERRTYAVTAY